MRKPTVLRIGLEVKDPNMHEHIRSVETVTEGIKFGFGAHGDLFITDDPNEIERHYVPEKYFAFVGLANPFAERQNVLLINPADSHTSALNTIEKVRDEFMSCAA